VPTYQYACTECGHAFEQFQSFSDEALTECPVCAGRLRKVFNAVGVVFKGSGFYRTDSRDKQPASSSETTSDTSSDTKTDTKTDTKSETRSGTKSGPAPEAKSGSRSGFPSDAKAPATA
jgi:putative FmdB family regulatory protein